MITKFAISFIPQGYSYKLDDILYKYADRYRCCYGDIGKACFRISHHHGTGIRFVSTCNK